MTHKLRTLQGQLRSAIHRNAALAAERDAALKSAHSAQCAYYEATHQRDEARRRANQREIDYQSSISRADSVAHLHTHPRMETELKVPSGHVIIDKHFFDALQRLITHDIASQAGWKL